MSIFSHKLILRRRSLCSIKEPRFKDLRYPLRGYRLGEYALLECFVVIPAYLVTLLKFGQRPAAPAKLKLTAVEHLPTLGQSASRRRKMYDEWQRRKEAEKAGGEKLDDLARQLRRKE